MRQTLLGFTILIFTFSACGNKTDTVPQITTIIDLDKTDQTIEIEEISVKLIYNNEWYESNPDLKKCFIPWTTSITEGTLNTFYVLDFSNNRIVQFAENGNFIKSISGPGSGPGELLRPNENIYNSGKNIYVSDNYGLLLHLFDLQGNYVRTIANASVEGGMFSIGKKGIILSTPTIMDDTIMKYKILIQDSLGNDIDKIGSISDYDNFIFKNVRENFYERELYYIVANEKVDHIWCVFWFYPIIQKYDYQGNFIEEIHFQSKTISKMLNESVSLRKQKKANIGGFHLLRKPHLTSNGDLLMNIASYGNIQVASNDTPTSVRKKFKIVLETDENLKKKIDPDGLLLKAIHNKYYAYDFELIFQEINPNNE